MNDGHDSLILKFPIGKIFFSIGKVKDIREELTEKYGITDEGDIVSLTDLEMREEILPEGHSEEGKR